MSNLLLDKHTAKLQHLKKKKSVKEGSPWTVSSIGSSIRRIYPSTAGSSRKRLTPRGVGNCCNYSPRKSARKRIMIGPRGRHEAGNLETFSRDRPTKDERQSRRRILDSAQANRVREKDDRRAARRGDQCVARECKLVFCNSCARPETLSTERVWLRRQCPGGRTIGAGLTLIPFFARL